MTYDEREQVLTGLLDTAAQRPQYMAPTMADWVTHLTILRDINRELMAVLPLLAQLGKDHTEDIATIITYLDR